LFHWIFYPSDPTVEAAVQGQVKSFFRKLIPDVLVDGYRRLYRFREQRQNLRKTTEQVFTEIYDKNKWGGSRGEFCSGFGTVDERVVAPYVAMVFEQALREKFQGLTFVDLGCGDFRVGSRLRALASRYTGVDIVEPLIRHNQAAYADATTEFVHLNIAEDELPDGDVCFVRQVFQHLSNHQIASALEKLRKFQWVFITEHYPTDNAEIRLNLDKIHGGDIRLYENSGVYLSEAPFSLPAHALKLVLEVPGVGAGEWNGAGVIRTFLYKPRGER
jgi:SAM-dependent methyltransferase